MFENLTTDSSIAEDKDVLGGGRQLFDTDVYRATVGMAYGKKSDGGALAVALTFKLADGREFQKDVYTTNRNGQNFYERDGAKHYLPGFNLVNSLCLLTTGKELSQLPIETKTVKVWNKDSKAEVPTPVPVLVDLIGKECYVAIERLIEDKTAKNDSTGAYEPTGEIVEANDLAKIFCAREGFDGMTQTEIKAARDGKAPEVLFKDQWVEKYKGQVRNKAKGAAAGGNAGAPRAGAPKPAAAAKPTSSLFD